MQEQQSLTLQRACHCSIRHGQEDSTHTWVRRERSHDGNHPVLVLEHWPAHCSTATSSTRMASSNGSSSALGMLSTTWAATRGNTVRTFRLTALTEENAHFNDVWCMTHLCTHLVLKMSADSEIFEVLRMYITKTILFKQIYHTSTELQNKHVKTNNFGIKILSFQVSLKFSQSLSSWVHEIWKYILPFYKGLPLNMFYVNNGLKSKLFEKFKYSLVKNEQI